MSEVTEHIDINEPVSTVYNQWTQFEEFPRFMSAVKQLRQIDATTLHWTIEIGGVRREFDAKITEQIPDKRIAWKSVDGKTHSGVVTFHRIDDTQSRVMLQMAYDPEGFAENAASVLGIVSAQVRGDLDRFKEFIELRGRETGAWRGGVAAPGERRS